MKTGTHKSSILVSLAFSSAVACLLIAGAVILLAASDSVQDTPPVSSAATIADQIKALQKMERSILPQPPEIKRGPTGIVEIPQLTDATFAENVQQAQGLVVVCFTAQFSPQSKDQIEVLKNLELAGDFTVVQADMNQCRQAVQAARPTGFPSIYLYSNGQVIAKLNGFKDKDTLKREISKYLR